MQLRTKLTAVAIAGGSAALVLAGVPALASSHARASKPVTGPEVVIGAVYGHEATVNAPKIPLTLRGLVNTHGSILLNGMHSGIKTEVGNFFAKATGKQQKPQISANTKTCHEQFTMYLVGRVDGSKSTGAFAGASGPLAAQIIFAGYAPRYKSGKHKGQCNFNAPPLNVGAVATFVGSAVMTKP